MFILYDIGLVLSLLTGGVIGMLLTRARYDRIALRQQQYEAEAAQYRELYTALALYRRTRPGGSPDDEMPAA